jgi:hypothetical protein
MPDETPTTIETNEYGDGSTNAVVTVDPLAIVDGDHIFTDEEADQGLE